MRKLRYTCLKDGGPTGIWVCDQCRLRYADKILLRQWRLIDRSMRGDEACDLCAEALVEECGAISPRAADPA